MRNVGPFLIEDLLELVRGDLITVAIEFRYIGNLRRHGESSDAKIFMRVIARSIARRCDQDIAAMFVFQQTSQRRDINFSPADRVWIKAERKVDYFQICLAAWTRPKRAARFAESYHR